LKRKGDNQQLPRATAVPSTKTSDQQQKMAKNDKNSEKQRFSVQLFQKNLLLSWDTEGKVVKTG
jgi:hypothetical protein